MKFIKQSSIDNLIDEARIDVVIGATEELKERCSLFLLSFTGEKGTPLCVHVVKNFFMITQLFGGNSVQFIMKNTQR
jgi:hypothetical protein